MPFSQTGLAEAEPWRTDEVALLRASLARIDESVLVCDTAVDEDGMPFIRYASGGFLERTGWTTSALAGRTIGILLGTKTPVPNRHRLRNAIAARLPVRTEVSVFARDQREFWAECELVPLAAAGAEPDQWMVHVRDRTEQRQQVAQMVQARREAMMGRLAAAMAHDLNRAVGQVTMKADQLAKTLASEHPNHSALRQLAEEAATASRMARQFLVCSRRVRGEPVACDVNEVVLDMALLLRRLRSDALGIQTALEEPLPLVHADPILVEQALLTLGLAAHDVHPEPAPLLIETMPRVVHAAPILSDQDVPPGRYVVVRVGVSSLAWQRGLEAAHRDDPTGEARRAVGADIRQAVQQSVRMAGGWLTTGVEVVGHLTASFWLPVATYT